MSTTSPRPRRRDLLAWIPGSASVLAVLLGAAVLVGWWLDVPALKSVFPRLPRMTANTALTIMLAGFALGLLRKQPIPRFRRYLANLGAASVALMGLLTLGQYLFGWDLGIDQLLIGDFSGSPQTDFPGRPAFQTTLVMIFFGMALLLLDLKRYRGPQLSEILAVLVLLISLLALIGYTFNSPVLYGARGPSQRERGDTGVALHTAILVALLSLGLLFARPERGLAATLLSKGAGGTVARFLLLAPILIPVALGLLTQSIRLLGFPLRGELDSWLIVLLYFAVFTFIIWWCASFLHRMDTRRVEAERRFRAVAETATAGIVSANTQGNITYVNSAAERLFDYSAAQMIGKPLTLLMPERFHRLHCEGLARYLATGENHVIGKTVELVGRRRDSVEFPLELSLASWQAGEGTFFTGILLDVSERKRAEEDLCRANAQLEAANRELEAFSYSVSHDLRAPLRAMEGFSQALLADYAHGLAAEGQDYLRRVSAASRRMAELIDGLLHLSRLTRHELERERVDLSELARSVAAGLQQGQPERQVEFVLAEGVQASGDPRLLRVILENLLGNAWKFTAKHARARIEFGVAQKDDNTIYFIRDDGAGFDMAYSDKLFGAFQRLHGKTEFAGNGIGLATVQRVVRRHGGRIWAEAAVERGATFFFTLDNGG